MRRKKSDSRKRPRNQNGVASSKEVKDRWPRRIPHAKAVAIATAGSFTESAPGRSCRAAAGRASRYGTSAGTDRRDALRQSRIVRCALDEAPRLLTNPSRRSEEHTSEL